MTSTTAIETVIKRRKENSLFGKFPEKDKLTWKLQEADEEGEKEE